MSFPPSPAPAAPAAPAAPPPKANAKSQTIAQMSAMGTTAGAPTMQIAKGPPSGTGLPGSGPPAPTPGQAGEPSPNPQGPANQVPSQAAPPIGNAARPVVGAHAATRSLGTHASRSPGKRGNPTHPFGK